MRLIAPPLPPASRPSRTTSRPRSDVARTELTTEVQPQLEQPALGDVDASLVLARPSRCVRSSWSSRSTGSPRCEARQMGDGSEWDSSAADHGPSDVHAPILRGAP